MLDYHIILALRAMLPYYLGDGTFAAFSALFTGYAIDASVLSEWWTKLRAHSIEVRAFGAKASDQFPALVVSLSGEDQNGAPLGGVGCEIDGVKIEQTDVSGTASVSIWLGTPELCRAMHIVVRGIILGVRKNFLAAGYDDLTYGGADSPTPFEEQIADQLGVVVRRLTVSAKQRVSVPQVGPALTPKTWFVLAVDSGGGVVPYEE